MTLQIEIYKFTEVLGVGLKYREKKKLRQTDM